MCAVYVCINYNRKDSMATKSTTAPRKATTRASSPQVKKELPKGVTKDVPSISDIHHETMRLYGSSVDTTNGLLRAILCELIFARISRKGQQ